MLVAKNWEQALSYCENFEIAGHSDWRLPQAKELQSLIGKDQLTASPGFTKVAEGNDLKPKAVRTVITAYLDFGRD